MAQKLWFERLLKLCIARVLAATDPLWISSSLLRVLPHRIKKILNPRCKPSPLLTSARPGSALVCIYRCGDFSRQRYCRHRNIFSKLSNCRIRLIERARRAVGIFYDIKELELQIGGAVAALEDKFKRLDRSAYLRAVAERRKLEQSIFKMRRKYDEFIEEANLVEAVSDEDQLILRMARIFWRM